jgi:hypothetical protein
MQISHDLAVLHAPNVCQAKSSISENQQGVFINVLIFELTKKIF